MSLTSTHGLGQQIPRKGGRGEVFISTTWLLLLPDLGSLQKVSGGELMLLGCELLRRDICNSLSGEEEEGDHASKAVLEHLLSARQLRRKICVCLTGAASDRSCASG